MVTKKINKKNGNNNWKTPQRVDIYSNYKKRSLELNLYQKAWQPLILKST
jgi:hypothetical protein